MTDPQVLHNRLLGEINTQIRIEIGRRYDVWPDPSSVRAGWHSAGCNVGLCEWFTSGLETICDDAGAEHVAEAHAMDGPLPALRALFAAVKLHGPLLHSVFGVLCKECSTVDGELLRFDASPCATVRVIASALGVET